MAEKSQNQFDIDDLKAPLLAAVGAADLALERVNEIVAALRVSALFMREIGFERWSKRGTH